MIFKMVNVSIQADISTTHRIYAPYTAAERVRDQLETFGRSAKDAASDDKAG